MKSNEKQPVKGEKGKKTLTYEVLTNKFEEEYIDHWYSTIKNIYDKAGKLTHSKLEIKFALRKITSRRENTWHVIYKSIDFGYEFKNKDLKSANDYFEKEIKEVKEKYLGKVLNVEMKTSGYHEYDWKITKIDIIRDDK